MPFLKPKRWRLVPSLLKSVTVLKKPYRATWHFVIITAVTSLDWSNFLSTQSDACFRPKIFIGHVADLEFIHERVIQNSKSRIQNSKSWKNLPTHSAPTGILSKSSGFMEKSFNALGSNQSHTASYKNPFRPVRHQAPRRAIRPVGHRTPRRAIRPVGHRASRRAIRPDRKSTRLNSSHRP